MTIEAEYALSLIVRDDNGHSLACAIVTAIRTADSKCIDSTRTVPFSLGAQSHVISIYDLPISRCPFIAGYIW